MISLRSKVATTSPTENEAPKGAGGKQRERLYHLTS